MRPVSGWKLRAGSSVVTRHWMAQPLMRMFSCRSLPDLGLGHVDLGVDQVHTAGGGREGEGASVRPLALPAGPPQPPPDHARLGALQGLPEEDSGWKSS